MVTSLNLLGGHIVWTHQLGPRRIMESAVTYHDLDISAEEAVAHQSFFMIRLCYLVVFDKHISKVCRHYGANMYLIGVFNRISLL